RGQLGGRQRHHIVDSGQRAENGGMPHADLSAMPPFDLPPLEYDFLAPRQIVFGWGRRRAIGKLAASLGGRACVVTSSRTLEKTGVLAELFDLLKHSAVEAIAVSISHEPEVNDVDRLSAQLAELNPGNRDLVIGIGGGSAIDLAKAAAAMATNRE